MEAIILGHGGIEKWRYEQMITYKELEINDKVVDTKGKAKYKLDSKELFAEELAISNYEKEGFKAIWTENDYWITLMALLFWDIIFAKVKGAVLTLVGHEKVYLEPFDSRFLKLFSLEIDNNGMPADLFTDGFYLRRKQIIINRFTELRNSDLLKRICDTYKAHRGKRCRLIPQWDKFGLDKLEIVIKMVNKEKILPIFERIIMNINDNRAGLPDLIVYSDNDLFFSEVKSEQDKISIKQKYWHEYLSEKLGFKVEIFLINQSKESLQKAVTKLEPKSKTIRISVGSTTSKKFDDAIVFLKEQESYFEEKKDEKQRYGADFKITDIKKLWKILDLTTGWKTQIIKIDGEVIKSTQLRNSLYCFKKKEESTATDEYCTATDVIGSKCAKKFGCKNIYINQIETDRWDNYGFVDTVEGKWKFDKNTLEALLKGYIERLKFCPFFDPRKVLTALDKIPIEIDPKTDANWSFITNEAESWSWNNGQWKQVYAWEERPFPGYSVMTGIEKIRSRNSRDMLRVENVDLNYTSYNHKRANKSGNIFLTILKVIWMIIAGIFIIFFKILAGVSKKRR